MDVQSVREGQIKFISGVMDSNLKSYENFSCEMVSYFLQEFFIYGLCGFGELIEMNIV